MISSQSPAENPAPRFKLTLRTALPFLGVGFFWLLLSGLLSWRFEASQEEGRRALIWLALFWLLSLLDLVALAKLMEHVFGAVTQGQTRIFSAIRASYWGALKLACIVLFGTLLWKGGSSPAGIPLLALLMGISTVVVVPLLGGLLWHFLSGPFDDSSEDDKTSKI